jgi:poly-gamma-glutamate synthesis protein (capsule biosynthesis protein)
MRSRPSAASLDLGLVAGLLVILLAFWKVVLWSDEPTSSPIRLIDGPARAPAAPADLPRSGTPSLTIRLGFAGDIMQHRAQAGDDYRRSYAEIGPLVRGFDLAVANLEVPVDTTRPIGPPAGSIQFNGSPRHLDALAQAGFDLLSVANNHAFDQGPESLRRTVRAIGERGIIPLGSTPDGDAKAPGPVVRDIRGLRLAVTAYTIPPNPYVDTAGVSHWPPPGYPLTTLNFDDWGLEYRAYGRAVFQRDVARARQAGARFLVAFVHWGREWSLQPTEDQRLAARDLVEAGYDLVVGSHGHVLNAPDLVDGKLVAYSMGNLISDFRTLETRTGAILEVSVSVDAATGVARVTDFAYVPTLVRLDGHIVTVVDSTVSRDQARAWSLARRMLGPGVRAPASR